MRFAADLNCAMPFVTILLPARTWGRTMGMRVNPSLVGVGLVAVGTLEAVAVGVVAGFMVQLQIGLHMF